MELVAYLEQDLRPALGCTEPAAVAYAAARAAEQAGGEVLAVHLGTGVGVFKNCQGAVLPRTGGLVGIEWAVAIGAVLPDASAELESFQRLDAEMLREARRLVASGAVHVTVEPQADGLHVDCRVTRADGEGRAVLSGRHTALARLERDGQTRPLPAALPGGAPSEDGGEALERWLRSLSLSDALRLSERPDAGSRSRLREAREHNLAIAHEGLALLPEAFVQASRAQPGAWASCLVGAGVRARMSGVERVVTTLAGSGNKGITVAVGLALEAERLGASPELLDRAHALACLVTSSATRHLGITSPMCGAANAAGIGLAAGLVALHGGGQQALSRAVDNMVGNVAGMLCDGAKPGCGLKAATAVDAAIRAAALALAGLGLTPTDGIVGADADRSLENLGRVARRGMPAAEAEVVRILGEKPEAGAGRP